MTIIFPGVAASAVITVTVSLFFVFFFVLSFRRMKWNRKEAVSKIMVMAPLTALFYILSDIIYYRCVTNFMIYEIVLSVMPITVAMKADIGWDKALGYGAVTLVISVITMLLRLLLPRGTVWIDDMFSFAPLIMTLSLIIVLQQDFYKLLTDRKRIIKNSTVRYRITSGLDIIYMAILFIAMVTDIVLDDVGLLMKQILFVLAVIIVLLLSAFCFIRISDDRLLVISRKKDNELKELMSVCMADSKEALRGDQAYRSIYERLVAYFEREAPYLDPELTVEDVAKELYCNRLYLSKAISMFTGRNFCQFVNYYRIRHAVKIFEEDKGLKLGVWSELSGYRTLANFNIAFRLFMNDTPGEWCRKVRGELPKYKRDK